jgi:hypothetical protein
MIAAINPTSNGVVAETLSKKLRRTLNTFAS